MNNSQVAHLWANQSRPRAKGSSFYFEGATIYSYGPHFPIARIIERKGKKAVLFTTRRYSVTTAKHIGITCRALYGLSLPVFTVHDVSGTPRTHEVKEDYAQRIKAECERAARARSTWRMDSSMGCARELAQQANACAEFHGWRWRLKAPEWSAKFRDEMRAKLKAADARKAAETKRREELRRAELAKLVVQWRAGTIRGLGGYPDTLLRVNGEEIETSRGARIPVSHAARIWRLILAVKARGTPYEHNGHSEHAGEFRIDRIDPDGTLHAGCHTLKFPELALLARGLGLEGA